MKAKLIFNLDDYSDKLLHKRCISATSAYLVLSCLREYLFDQDDNEDNKNTLNKLNDFLDYYGVDLNDLE